LLTSSTTRGRTPVSVTRHVVAGPNAAASSPKRARSSAAPNGSESARTTWRVENQPVSGSEW
jgi:hypothetical protein